MTNPDIIVSNYDMVVAGKIVIDIKNMTIEKAKEYMEEKIAKKFNLRPHDIHIDFHPKEENMYEGYWRICTMSQGSGNLNI